jgi:uncharacterized membrane protein YphA (DoxX/SURF4 family)
MKLFLRFSSVVLGVTTAGTGTASAHVDYVSQGEGPPVTVGELLAGVFGSPLNVALLVGGGLFAAAAAATYLRYAAVLTDVQVGIRTLKSYRPYLPWMLRLSIGLPLVGAGFAGYYFSPSVAVEARLLQAFLGFMLLFGLATRPIAGLGLVAYLVGLATHFPELLLASEYVPGFLAIIAIGPGQPSADMLIRRVVQTEGTFLSRFRDTTTPEAVLARVGLTHEIVPTILRLGLGLNFMYLGVTQKWLNPGQGLAVVEQYDLAALVPVAPELWVFGAGLVEFGVGLLLVVGCFTRGTAAAGFVIFTTTLFGLPDDPVLAHITLFGLASALLVTGSGPYALDRGYIPRLHRRLAATPKEPSTPASGDD